MKNSLAHLCSSRDGSKPWYLVNPKIAGKWMFIPLKMVLIGIDPYSSGSVQTLIPAFSQSSCVSGAGDTASAVWMLVLLVLLPSNPRSRSASIPPALHPKAIRRPGGHPKIWLKGSLENFSSLNLFSTIEDVAYIFDSAYG